MPSVAQVAPQFTMVMVANVPFDSWRACAWRAGGLDPRDLKTALFCISFLRKGEVLAYVVRIHNLKDLKDPES